MAMYPLEYVPIAENCLMFLCTPVEEMFRIIDRYINTRTKYNRWSDRLYNLNERATLSVLAGAIWHSNPENFVFDESCGDKTSESGIHRSPHGHGTRLLTMRLQ